jgi:putative ABC transport system substrate-binding protein
LATHPPITDLGGLLGYGPARRNLLVRMGYYVKRILDGADPADLPVEQPVQIELWLNLKTAKQLAWKCRPNCSRSRTRWSNRTCFA